MWSMSPTTAAASLTTGCATVDVLPEVVAAVGGRAKIMIDGGFMRGADVVKAIALGAHAVGLGKLLGMGLAAGGQDGVLRTLEILGRRNHYDARADGRHPALMSWTPASCARRRRSSSPTC